MRGFCVRIFGFLGIWGWYRVSSWSREGIGFFVGYGGEGVDLRFSLFISIGGMSECRFCFVLI